MNARPETVHEALRRAKRETEHSLSWAQTLTSVARQDLELLGRNPAPLDRKYARRRVAQALLAERDLWRAWRRAHDAWSRLDARVMCAATGSSSERLADVIAFAQSPHQPLEAA